MKPYITVLVVVVLIELCASYQQCCVSIRHESEGKCGAELSEQTPDICFIANDKLQEVFNDNNKEYCIWDCDGHLSSMYNQGHYISILSEHAPSHLYPNYMKLRHVDTMGVAYTVVHNLTIEFTSNIIPIYYNLTKRRRLFNEDDFKSIDKYTNPTNGDTGAAHLPFQATGVLTSWDTNDDVWECVASVFYITNKPYATPATPAKYDIALLTSAHCCWNEETETDNKGSIEFYNIDQNSFPGSTRDALLGNNAKKGSPKYKYFHPNDFVMAARIDKYLSLIKETMEGEHNAINKKNKKMIEECLKRINGYPFGEEILQVIATIKKILDNLSDPTVNNDANKKIINDAIHKSLEKAKIMQAELDWCVIKWSKIKLPKNFNVKHTLQIKYDSITPHGKLLMSTYRTPKQEPPGKTYYKKYMVTKVQDFSAYYKKKGQKKPQSIWWLGHEKTAWAQSGSPFVEESDPTKIRAILSRSRTHHGHKRAKDVEKDWLTVITMKTFDTIATELNDLKSIYYYSTIRDDGKGKVAGGTAQAIASDYGDYQQTISYHQHHQHHPQKMYVHDGIKSDYPVEFGVGIISGVIVAGTIGFICIFIGYLIGVIAAKFVWNLNKKY